jgi:transcriptional regulator with XRE-family HTH domain
MTTFRNLEFDAKSSVDEWPMEAIETLIDRGSLSDWRRLADAIRRNPWGPAARRVETIVAWGEHYGVDALLCTVLRRAREQVDQRGRAHYAAQIRSWRAQTGMTLRQFAVVAGTSASRLSDYENEKVAPTTDVLGRLAQVASIHATAHPVAPTARRTNVRRADRISSTDGFAPASGDSGPTSASPQPPTSAAAVSSTF